MYFSYFIHKVNCKLDLRCFRFIRWTIVVPFVIYLSLLFFKYNRNVPLKSLTSTTSIQDDKESMTENLFIELEAMTIDKRDLEHYKEIDQNIKNVKENQENSRILLEDIFQRADTDHDQLLDIQELARWIHTKITDHISRAMKENIGLFTAIDNNPRNGEVSWEEYHAYFLRSHGFPESYVSSHDKKHSDMSRTLKENIMRDRARWSEAARNDPERLALDEFLAFTHPTSMMLREGSTVDAGNDLNAGDCSMIITHSAGRSGGGVFPPRQHNLIHPLDLISSSSISITDAILWGWQPLNVDCLLACKSVPLKERYTEIVLSRASLTCI